MSEDLLSLQNQHLLYSVKSKAPKRLYNVGAEAKEITHRQLFPGEKEKKKVTSRKPSSLRRILDPQSLLQSVHLHTDKPPCRPCKWFRWRFQWGLFTIGSEYLSAEVCTVTRHHSKLTLANTRYQKLLLVGRFIPMLRARTYFSIVDGQRGSLVVECLSCMHDSLVQSQVQRTSFVDCFLKHILPLAAYQSWYPLLLSCTSVYRLSCSLPCCSEPLECICFSKPSFLQDDFSFLSAPRLVATRKSWLLFDPHTWSSALAFL